MLVPYLIHGPQKNPLSRILCFTGSSEKVVITILLASHSVAQIRLKNVLAYIHGSTNKTWRAWY